MKRLVCEMCGGTDLIKEDSAFACQSCGTKYSVEEAKKMMVEGTVEVAGTVKVDNTDKLSNLYQLARRAKEQENAENAAKYYDMILLEDPNSWEATFYVVYFKSYSCKIAEIVSAAISVNNCIEHIMGLIKNHVAVENQPGAVTEIYDRVVEIGVMLNNAAANHYAGIDDSIKHNYIQELVNNQASVYSMFYNLGDQIEHFFGSSDFAQSLSCQAWESGITIHNLAMPNLADKEGNKNLIIHFSEKIKKYNTSFVEPTVKTGGCYVATAIYGSYDCPQVWTLRRFRDNTLAKSCLGRAVIKFYYATSPIIVKQFGRTTWFNNIVKKRLDNLVDKLNKQGVEDKPYYDR